MSNLKQVQLAEKKSNNLILNLIALLSLVLVIYTIITKAFHSPDPFIDRGIYLLFSVIIVYLFQYQKVTNNSRKIILSIGVMLSIIGCIYIIFSSDKIINNWFMADINDYYVFLLYFAGLFIILFGSGIGGKIISIMGILSVAYLYLGRFLPGDFTLPDLLPTQIATMVFTDIDQGAFGTFMSVVSRVLSLFLMFSALLITTGLGDLIRSLSMLLAGNSQGGPAKVAVISSAMFGMLSGSPVANVAATGSFTIPLMKSIGYKPRTAGAIETIASTGGSITPPIMGISAFIMAEIIGVPYITIITWAIIPAFFWYYTTYLYVHYAALSQGVKIWKPPREELLVTLKSNWHLAISIVALVYFLITLRVAELAAFYSLIALFILSFLSKQTRLNIEKTKEFLVSFAKIFTNLCLLNTMLGIFTAALLSTGAHTKLILLIFGGITNWVILLLITFALCILFGMLVPPFAAYITVVLVAVPILNNLGYSVPVIHMFVLYGCALAPITPPVALAAYTAASIADADPIETAREASLKALPLWIIPFIIFKYHLHIGMQDSWISLLSMVAVLMIGIYIFTMASNKYCVEKIYSKKWIIWLYIVSLAIVQPMNMMLSYVACAIGIASATFLYIRKKKKVALEG